jgi:hypothetical protein
MSIIDGFIDGKNRKIITSTFRNLDDIILRMDRLFHAPPIQCHVGQDLSGADSGCKLWTNIKTHINDGATSSDLHHLDLLWTHELNEVNTSKVSQMVGSHQCYQPDEKCKQMTITKVASGENGTIFRCQCGTKNVIIKQPIIGNKSVAFSQQELLHECCVGSLLNRFIVETSCPNFVFTYGLLVNSKQHSDGQPGNGLLGAMAIEHVAGTTLTSWMETKTDDPHRMNDFKCIIRQVVMALLYANEHSRFVHADMHTDNVMVVDPDGPTDDNDIRNTVSVTQQSKPAPINYHILHRQKPYTQNAKYIAKILDYGFSSISCTRRSRSATRNGRGLIITNGSHPYIQFGVHTTLLDIHRLLVDAYDVAKMNRRDDMVEWLQLILDALYQAFADEDEPEQKWVYNNVDDPGRQYELDYNLKMIVDKWLKAGQWNERMTKWMKHVCPDQ